MLRIVDKILLGLLGSLRSGEMPVERLRMRDARRLGLIVILPWREGDRDPRRDDIDAVFESQRLRRFLVVAKIAEAL